MQVKLHNMVQMVKTGAKRDWSSLSVIVALLEIELQSEERIFHAATGLYFKHIIGKPRSSNVFRF